MGEPNTHRPAGCWGCLGLAVSQGDFLSGLSALGESSLKSSPKPKGQMASRPKAPPRKAGSQRSHAQPRQRMPFSREELLRARGSQPRLPLMRVSQLSPFFFFFFYLGASGTLGKLRDFSNPKREYISLRWMDEYQCPPFTHPVARGDLALTGRTYFRTQSRNFSVYISQKTSSLD